MFEKYPPNEQIHIYTQQQIQEKKKNKSNLNGYERKAHAADLTMGRMKWQCFLS